MEDGTEIRARMMLSNADPKRTFLQMVAAKDLPEDFLFAIRGIKMDGPCAKVNMVSVRGTAIHRDFTAGNAAGAHVLHAGSIARIR